MLWRTMGEKSEKGQASVEFLLTGIFVFFTFLFALEMFFFMHTYNTLADSAKEGIRYAIVHGIGNTNCSGPGTAKVTCSDTSGNNVKDTVVQYAVLSAPLVRANVNVDYNPGSANGALCNQPGCLVRVTVNYQYSPLFGLGWPSVQVNAAADGRIMN